jgi:hypothetical protein
MKVEREAEILTDNNVVTPGVDRRNHYIGLPIGQIEALCKGMI